MRSYHLWLTACMRPDNSPAACWLPDTRHHPYTPRGTIMTNTEPLYTLWVCTDCVMQHANGEHSPDRPADYPPVWSKMMSADVTLGMVAAEHASDCDPVERAEQGCSCETITFSNGTCEACGLTLAGARHAMTYWGEHPEPEPVNLTPAGVAEIVRAHYGRTR